MTNEQHRNGNVAPTYGRGSNYGKVRWHSDDAISAAIDHVSRTWPYYLSALTRLRIVPDRNVATMGTSEHWVTHYNPATVAGWTTAETGAVLVHELEHLLRRHHERCGERDPQRWNIAGDAEINQRLTGLPSGAVTPESLGMPRGQTAERYYGATDEQPQPQGGAGDPGQPGDGSGQPGAGQPGQGQPQCGSAAGGGTQPHEQADAANPGRGADADEAAAAEREAAEGILGHRPGIGTDPGDERREWAERTIGIDRSAWYRALSAAVGHVMAPHGAPTRYQWPGRREMRDMGGAMVPRWTGTRPRCAVVIDTSGSVTPFDLEMAVAATHYLVRMADVTVYSCTTEAKRLGSRVPDGLRGGGGTDMGAGIAMAAADGAKAVVVITDMMTPWPAEAPAGVAVIVGANPQASNYGYTDPGRYPDWLTVLPVIAAGSAEHDGEDY